MALFSDTALLTVAETREADRLAISGGTTGIDLMESAGEGTAKVIQRRFAARPTVVLCGPGNNGGDGFVIGRILRGSGWPVRVSLLGSADALQGDAATAADRWGGPVEAASPARLDGAGLVVDALFGAGLSRDLSGPARDIVEALRDRVATGSSVSVAVDMPSGLDGDTGRIRGAVAPATVTVTFFRAKPGHLLLPGRDHCGAVRVLDIGIPDIVLNSIQPRQGVNRPSAWADRLPVESVDDHKYRRGHAVVVGGAVMTGAARLATEAARRIGAGLLTIAAPPRVANVYRAGSAGVLVADCEDNAGFRRIMSDSRRNAVLVGPGLGVEPLTMQNALTALTTGRALVLDADALGVFADNAAAIAEHRAGPLVITPHDAEFVRLFPDLGQYGKLERARIAADRTGAVVVLKGSDTVIADPDGRALVNDNAPPSLATGGTGDVLAGTVLGLLARGMPAFEAAAAAVWINAAAATAAGPGLLAEDLPSRLWQSLMQARQQG